MVAASADLDEVSAGDEVELDEFPDEPVRRRNPYFIALVVLPVVLLYGRRLLDGLVREQHVRDVRWQRYSYDYVVATSFR